MTIVLLNKYSFYVIQKYTFIQDGDKSTHLFSISIYYYNQAWTVLGLSLAPNLFYETLLDHPFLEKKEVRKFEKGTRRHSDKSNRQSNIWKLMLIVASVIAKNPKPCPYIISFQNKAHLITIKNRYKKKASIFHLHKILV